MCKPVVKWAGGKTQLLDELLPLVPEYDTYYEVFVGGGALFFALKPKKAVLNDFNKQLMNLYKQIKYHNTQLQKQLDILENQHIDSPEYYNRKRGEFNEYIIKNEYSLISASLFLYLNKTGYNGLYRLNSNGLFNTPYGKKKKVKLYDKDNMDSVSRLLKGTRLLNGDFEKACKDCKKGDFVFFDSPYYNTFDTYQAGGFSKDDHIRLSSLFDYLTSRGVKCLLTNSNEKFIKDLYKKYDIKVVDVKRMINCDGNKRTGKEIIVKNY